MCINFVLFNNYETDDTSRGRKGTGAGGQPRHGIVRHATLRYDTTRAGGRAGGKRRTFHKRKLSTTTSSRFLTEWIGKNQLFFSFLFFSSLLFCCVTHLGARTAWTSPTATAHCATQRSDQKWRFLIRSSSSSSFPRNTIPINDSALLQLAAAAAAATTTITTTTTNDPHWVTSLYSPPGLHPPPPSPTPTPTFFFPKCLHGRIQSHDKDLL